MSAPVGGGLAVRVLVAAASKHGATAEIAERIAATLRTALPSAEVDSQPAGTVAALGRYDAVVLGSAVYAGRWLDSARNLAVKHSAELARVPVWLFSSGPIGAPPKPREDPVDAAPLMVATGAREHAVFAGKLDRHHLRFAERAVATALRAPDGDFRDWAEIDAWASRIARELQGA